MSFYEKLRALNIELPTVATPAAAYVMYAQTGNTVFVSGHIAKKDGKPQKVNWLRVASRLI
jgi:enamine deaminase RidA (YjgF/YER057c/UK114 family)